MTTARELMSPDPVMIRTADTVREAAERMAEFGVGALPICGEDGELKGVITDRDIVVAVLAAGKDPRAVHAGELARGEVVSVDADDDAADVLETMIEHQLRRVPVVESGDVVGIVAQADLARSLGVAEAGVLVEGVSSDTDRPGGGPA